jgi:anti-sigma B factor antagonist
LNVAVRRRREFRDEGATSQHPPRPTGVQCLDDALASDQRVKVTSKHPYLTVDVTSAAEAQTIALTGEADLLGAPEIESALKDASAGEQELIVIDLRNLTFIDSSGLQALITGHELCRARGHELRIVPGPENVQRLFELAGMEESLPFVDASDLDAGANSSSDDTAPRAQTWLQP